MTIEQPIQLEISRGHIPGRETYDALVSPNIRPLERWVRNKAPSGEDADDIIQQTLLLALKHIGQFRNEASFSTWLCRIAINVIRGRLRMPDRQRTVSTDQETLENWVVDSRGDSPLAAFERKQATTRLHRAISQLPDIYRVVIELRDLQGLSIQETAHLLGLSRPAVKSRHLRARRKLLKSYNAA